MASAVASTPTYGMGPKELTKAIPQTNAAMAGAPVELDNTQLSTLHTVMNDALAALTTQGYKPSPAPAYLDTGLGGKAARWVQPNELSEEDALVIKALKQVVECRSMADHHKAFANLASNVRWDAPPVLLTGRDSMRDMVYVAKTIATMTFDVIIARSEVVDATRRRLTMEVNFHVMPLSPPGIGRLFHLVVPHDIVIKATIVIGVTRPVGEATGSWGSIDLIYGRWHNLPVFPNFIRFINATAMGHLLRATEHLWEPLLPLMGDKSEKERGSAGPAAARPY